MANMGNDITFDELRRQYCNLEKRLGEAVEKHRRLLESFQQGGIKLASAEVSRLTERLRRLEKVIRNLVQLIVGLSPDHAKSVAILEAQALAREK